MQILEILLVIALLLPNIGLPQPLRLGSDVQPLGFVLCIIYILLRSLAYGRSKVLITRITLYLSSIFIIALLLAILSTLFLNVSSSSSVVRLSFLGEAETRALYGYLQAATIIIAASNLPLQLVSRVLYFTPWIIIAGYLLNLVSGNSVTGLLVNRAIYDLQYGGGRGLTSFFSEQSLIVSTCLIYYLISRILVAKGVQAPYPDRYWVALLVFITVLSASGQILVIALICILMYLISLFFCLIKFNFLLKRSFFVKHLIFLIVSVLILKIGFTAFSTSRIFAILSLFSSNLSNFNLSFLDAGARLKLSSLFFPFLSPLFYPFDLTLGKIFAADQFPLIYQAWDNISFFIFRVKTAYGIPLYSIIGNLSFDFGLFGLILIFCFLFIVFRSLSITRTPFYISSLILVAGFLNLSLSYSPYYLLIGLLGSAPAIVSKDYNYN